jgi:hypothetical protein
VIFINSSQVYAEKLKKRIVDIFKKELFLILNEDNITLIDINKKSVNFLDYEIKHFFFKKRLFVGEQIFEKGHRFKIKAKFSSIRVRVPLKEVLKKLVAKGVMKTRIKVQDNPALSSCPIDDILS